MGTSRPNKLCLLFLIGILGTVGCGNDFVGENNPQGVIKEQSTDKEGDEGIKINPSDITYVEPDYTSSETICTLQDTISMNGISYNILSWEKTKEFGNRNRETLADYLGDMVDLDNNFIGDESYLFITMTITNETEETMEVCRTPGMVVTIDENMQVLQMGECIYIDEYWYGGDAKSVYYYSLKPGESVTCEFAHMVLDSEANIEGRSLYYEIKHSDDLTDIENRFILLEE